MSHKDLRSLGILILTATLSLNVMSCTVEESASGVSGSSTCGNSANETGETCDDGNATSGDGCSAACAAEAGYTCTTAELSVCTLDASPFKVAVNEPNGATFSYNISKNGDGKTACAAADGEDVLCVVDIPELDLWAHGYKLTDTVPASVCSYIGFVPYYFNIAPFGAVSPTGVTYATDADSNIADVPGALGTDIYYYIPAQSAGGAVPGWTAHATLFGTAAATPADMRCPYDYTDIIEDGKNCCRGTYALTTIDSDGAVSSTLPDWPGKEANCFDGPAMVSTHPKDDTFGLPVYLTTTVPTTGLSTNFSMTSRYKSFVRTSATGWQLDNTFMSNYFSKAQHSTIGGAVGDVPAACQPARFLYPRNLIDSSCYYQYDCLDTNFEVKARIRVSVREWNLRSELLLLLAGSSANSDSTGNETPPSQSSSDTSPTPSAGPKNDFLDWYDVDGAASYLRPYTSFGFTTLGTPSNYIPYPVSNYRGFKSVDTAGN